MSALQSDPLECSRSTSSSDLRCFRVVLDFPIPDVTVVTHRDHENIVNFGVLQANYLELFLGVP